MMARLASEQHSMPISDAMILSLDSQVPFPAANTTPTCPSGISERENCENSVAAMFVQFTRSIFHLTAATAKLAVIDDGVTIISNSIFANLNPELFSEFDPLQELQLSGVQFQFSPR